jgi:hypothetical protein
MLELVAWAALGLDKPGLGGVLYLWDDEIEVVGPGAARCAYSSRFIDEGDGEMDK